MMNLASEMNELDINNVCHMSVHRYVPMNERPKPQWVRMVSHEVFEEYNGRHCSDMEVLNTLSSWACCHECFEKNDFVKELKEKQGRPWNYWKYLDTTLIN